MRTVVVFTLVGMLFHNFAVRATDVSIARLDCGLMTIQNISYFSDAHHYDGQPGEATNGCYLIRHKNDVGERYLLWDAGLGAELINNPRDDGDGWVSSLNLTIETQLASLGLEPGDIDFLGISHFHGDHIGQANTFKASTLLIGQRDIDYLKNRPTTNARRRLAPWFDGDSQYIGLIGDHDVFGDSSVTILSLPGHTHGHQGLLVKLAGDKYVLLSGDLYHYQAEIGKEIVSRWNKNRAETLASQKRFESIIKVLTPIVIVQHDRQDIKKLPQFPEHLK